MSSAASLPTSDHHRVVVADTMIASAWLGRTVSARRARWADTLGRAGWILPFVVVAEMRFGARVASWGPRRTAALERLVANTQVSPPLPEVIAAYRFTLGLPDVTHRDRLDIISSLHGLRSPQGMQVTRHAIRPDRWARRGTIAPI